MSGDTYYRVEATSRDGRLVRYPDTHSERERDEQIATAQTNGLREPIGYTAITQHGGHWGPQTSRWYLAEQQDRGAER